MLCPYCKGEIPDDAKKCMKCGEWIDISYKTGSEQPQGCLGFLWETIVNLLWFFFIAGVITVAILLYLSYHGYELF